MEPQPTNLTAEELEVLKSRLTMLDIYRARKSSVDAANRGLAAYYEAAKRIALVGPSTTLEEFLVRITADAFNEAMSEDPADPNLRTRSRGGETERTFSDGTDSDLETSSS